MTEIWNLSAICRCCHLDGNFKSLELAYQHQNTTEVYSVMIEETFGLSVFKPPKNKSYSICDECIKNLRDAAKFRQQIISCEEKFKEYLLNDDSANNKTSLLLGGLSIKQEIDGGNDFDDCDFNDVPDLYDIKNEARNEAIKNEVCDSKKVIKTEAPLKLKIRKSTINQKTKQQLNKKSKQAKTKKTTPSPPKNASLKDSETPKKLRKSKKLEPNCEECGVVFQKRSEVTLHNNVYHKYRGTYTCIDCPQEYEQIEQMFEHVQTHGKDAVKCRFCSKHFQDKTIHTEHENSVHTKEIVHICDICNKRYFSKSVIIKHMLMHIGLNKKVFCETCGHSFNDRANLRNHIDAVHLNLRKFNCDQCDKTFKAKKALKEHIAIKHLGMEYAKYTCKECGVEFNSWRHRRYHMQMQHPKDNVAYQSKEIVIDHSAYSYYCKVCPEVFHNRGRFKAHVLRHSKEGKLPHMCHVCGLSFSSTYTLKRHEALHLGLKSYKCDICQKAFAHPTQVVRHKKNVHNPVKREKIKCPICKQNVRNMEKHLKIHTIRPYMCEHCHRSYPEKNTLNRHVREFHLRIFKHNCDLCNTKFRNVKVLAKHRRTCVGEFKPDAGIVDHALPSEYSVEVEINP